MLSPVWKLKLAALKGPSQLRPSLACCWKGREMGKQSGRLVWRGGNVEVILKQGLFLALQGQRMEQEQC